MAAIFKLLYNGTMKTLGDWGFAQPRRTLVSQDVDRVSLESDPDDASTDALIIPRGVHVTLYRNSGEVGAADVQWFVGRVEEIKRSGSGTSQRISYVIYGLMWYLKKTIYQHRWNRWVQTIDGWQSSPMFTSHLMLNICPIGLNAAGVAYSTTDVFGRWTVRSQIDDVLTYINAAYVAGGGAGPLIQWNVTEFPAGYNDSWDVPIDGSDFGWLPYEEVRDTTCLEVIRRQLRFDLGLLWMDYSTIPPTLHCKNYKQILGTPGAVKTLDLNDVAGTDTEWNFTPRYDLQIPEVVINFEYANQANNSTYTTITQLLAPPGATGQKPQALVQTIDMQGVQQTISSQPIAVVPINADSTDTPTRLAWWKRHEQNLNASNVSGLTITNVAFLTLDGVPISKPYANELVGGAITPWMKTAPTNVNSVEIWVTADSNYTVSDKNSPDPWHKGVKQIKTKITASNAVGIYNSATGRYEANYSAVTSETEAEAYPANLAINLYAAFSTLVWEGDITITEDEISGSVQIGNVVNVINGNSDWATMNAVVQSITEDYENGETTIKVGPPQQLGVTDFLDYFRMGRWRRKWTNPAQLASGRQSGSSSVFGQDVPKENTTAQNPNQGYIKFADPTAPTAPGYTPGAAVLNVSDMGGKTDIKFREVGLCDLATGLPVKLRTLASAPYSPT